MYKPRDFLKDTAKWKAQAIQSDLQTPELVRWASIPLFSFLRNKEKLALEIGRPSREEWTLKGAQASQPRGSNR